MIGRFMAAMGTARARATLVAIVAVCAVAATTSCGTPPVSTSETPGTSVTADAFASAPPTASSAPRAGTTPEATVSVSPAATSSTTPTSTGPAFGAALTAVQFAAALREPDTTIIDVRTPVEFAEDHLPGSVNVPIAGNFRDAMASRDKAHSYAIYCQTGNRSAQALQVMKELGFTRAYHLAGGIVSWRQAGGQVTP